MPHVGGRTERLTRNRGGRSASKYLETNKHPPPMMASRKHNSEVTGGVQRPQQQQLRTHRGQNNCSSTRRSRRKSAAADAAAASVFSGSGAFSQLSTPSTPTNPLTPPHLVDCLARQGTFASSLREDKTNQAGLPLFYRCMHTHKESPILRGGRNDVVRVRAWIQSGADQLGTTKQRKLSRNKNKQADGYYEQRDCTQKQ